VEDIKFKSGGGGVDEALEMAKKDIEKEPNNPLNYIWYGQFLERSAQTDEAEKAYRKAIEVDPSLAQAWDLLVRRMVANKKAAEAAETVREAGKPLAEKPAALAKLYERIGDNERAEHFYQAALEADPGELLSMKALVEFYFASGQSQKAIPYLDQIIEKTAKSTDKANLQILSLARRFKSKTLASTGDYEQILQATKLIEQNAKLIEKNGKPTRVLAPEDTQAIVTMLAVRPEPSSRAKAIALLEELPQIRPLEAREQSLLGQLYERGGQWEKGRDMMLAAITRRSDDVDILFPFAQMLIRHNEFDDASRWIDRLEELLAKAPPTSPMRQSVTILRARLLVHNGQKEEAVNTLDALLPRPVPQSHLALLEELARLMEEMDMPDAAEKLLTEYVGQEPRGMAAMAAFLSRRGQFDRAFEMLEQARKSQPTRVIMPAAIDALRRHPDLATKERFQMLEAWAKSGIEEESDPQQIELLLAEVYDLEGNSQGAIDVYRQMLGSPRVSIGQKALVKNNLAVLLAVTKTSPDNAAEGVKLIDEAIRVLGPTGDLLDTRAVAYMAAGKVELALADVRAALADAPTSSKYFHLAQAEKQANHRDAAREALAKAQQLGIVVGQFGPAEQKLYTQLVDELR
jgi:tetratricopeptide (TPR) repeat protein